MGLWGLCLCTVLHRIREHLHLSYLAVCCLCYVSEQYQLMGGHLVFWSLSCCVMSCLSSFIHNTSINHLCQPYIIICVKSVYVSNQCYASMLLYILMCDVSLRFLGDTAQVIKCSGSPMCGTIFFSLPPNTAASSGNLQYYYYTNVLYSRRQSYQCLQNKNMIRSYKISSIFHFINHPFQPLH